MANPFKIAVLLLVATLAAPVPASADFWARADRPWLAYEVDQSIFFCRTQPRVSANTRQFVGMLMGRQINKCMHALGWVGVAR